MIVLGIDSATAEVSVALVDDGRIVGHARQEQGKRNGAEDRQQSDHATTLLPLIDKLFSENNATVEQLGGIAVSIGPGSFTGLRVGLATAKGLAYESRVPLVGVSTLLANARRAGRGESLVGSMLDARKGEVYCALFRSSVLELTRLTPDMLMSVDAMILSWSPYMSRFGEPLLLIGDGATAYQRQLFDCFQTAEMIFDRSVASIACEVAKVGCAELVLTSARDGTNLTPAYLHSAAAELKLKRAVTH